MAFILKNTLPNFRLPSSAALPIKDSEVEYTFDVIRDGFVFDTSHNARLLDVNGTGYDISGGFLSADGTQSVTYTAIPTEIFENPFSVAIAFKASTPDVTILLGNRNDTTASNAGLQIWKDGSQDIKMSVAGSATPLGIAGTFNDDVWRLLVVRYDGASISATRTWDGIEVSATQTSNQLGVEDFSTILSLPRGDLTSEADIAYFRIEGREISDFEVDEMYKYLKLKMKQKGLALL